ncbi:MAG: M1 family aminopeptidase [Gemmatimonadales bacterium]
MTPGILLALAVQGQPLAHPREPYWQQRLRYDITATLDETRGTLSGGQRIGYVNNSPDTLRTFALHLYLNAFRPGSRWADADSSEGRRRFNDLRDPDYAYNRIRDVRIMGEPVAPSYPFAPDSTIVRFVLPRVVAPGDSFTVELGWEARPSTLPRRQGRRGRHYDFAQWYPRVVAYDRYGWQEHPLYPAGEFYGDFGEFHVTLDVLEDQVVGATGVPVCGDPGWERVNQNAGRPVEYGREAYGPVRCSGVAAAGRKRLRWVGKDVHHFAISMNPAYRYEGGRFGNALIHVLYRPGDEATWGGGIAVGRTAEALRWLDELFGPFPWPQITNLHRIEGGGTEFPMMVMDGSAGLGLILHEVGHNYLMGILANNEWKEGWLDEGFTSFQTTWYQELQGDRRGYPVLSRDILLRDLDRWSESVSQPAEYYRDFATYNAMVYDRGELFFHQLRAIVGDSAMRAILREYYRRWQLKHVDETAFREAAEAVVRRDLKPVFAQWLHGTTRYDYAVGRVRVERRGEPGGRGGQGGQGGQADSGFLTRVEVIRKAPGVFPVTVVVRSRNDSALTRVEGSADREWVELVTQERPREVELDPAVQSHDWNVLNNRKRRGLLGYRRAPRTSFYPDRLFSEPARRDGLTSGWVPTVWYNDQSGVTVGVRTRTNYLDRFERNVFSLSFNTRGLRHGEDRIGEASLRIRNPVWLYRPRMSQTLEAHYVEGRAGAAVSMERDLSRHQTLGTRRSAGLGLRWLATTDTRYLDPALWEDGGTIEASAWSRAARRAGPWLLSGRVMLGGGVEYRNRGTGITTDDRYDAQPYLRVLGELTARRTITRNLALDLRLFAGAIASPERPVKQRQLFVAGADPYEQLGNPFLRSRGALLVRRGIHYLMPGGGGLRGLSPAVSTSRLAAANAELSRALWTRPQGRLLRQVQVVAFTDWAVGNGDLPADGLGSRLVGDAGVGLRLGHRIGETSFTTRVDFPFYVSRSALAVSDREQALGLRWVFGFNR